MTYQDTWNGGLAYQEGSIVLADDGTGLASWLALEDVAASVTTGATLVGSQRYGSISAGGESGGSDSLSINAPAGSAIGDVQYVFISCHPTVPAPTVPGSFELWETITVSAHNTTYVYRRALDASTYLATFSVSWIANGTAHMRQYRDADGAVLTSGTGKSIPSTPGSLVERIAIAGTSNSASFPPSKGISFPTGTLHPSYYQAFTWYGGQHIDSAAVSGAVAPATTYAIGNENADVYPGWATLAFPTVLGAGDFDPGTSWGILGYVEPDGPVTGDVNANPDTLMQRTATGAARAQTPILGSGTDHPDDLINRGYATPYLEQVTENTGNISNLQSDLTFLDGRLDNAESQIVTLGGNMDNIYGRTVALEAQAGYVHFQNTASAFWTIPITIPRHVSVSIWIDGEEVEADVTQDGTNVYVSLPSPMTGYAILT